MATHTTEDIANPDGSVKVTIETEGDAEIGEKVHMHAHDEIAKALQAFDENKHPDDCDGIPMKVNWEQVLE